jgi:16S rRNA (cytidine1402-2'-O)-methyltransferase
MLYIVATPIGNLQDITLRAIETLKQVDLVAAEDTRVTGILLKHFGIDSKLISFHSHSNEKKLFEIIDILKEGKTVALVSDAGTPGISDPSFKLITECIRQGIEVMPIPGVSALVTALSVSGAPIDKFTYLGFLPMKKGRQTVLKSMANEPRTMVVYESVHRINKTLSELREFLGNRYICVGREMTKMFEEYYKGTIDQAIEHFKQKTPKGEFTLVIAPEGYNLAPNPHENEQ